MEDRPADRKRPRPETEGSAPYDRRDCCEGRDADRSKRDGSEENRTGGYLVVGNGGAGEVAMHCFPLTAGKGIRGIREGREALKWLEDVIMEH